MVIENKRRYFNEKYEQENLSVISQVHFERENDDYLKMLEYMSSMNIVNKCEYLVTGLSGGSEMAIYRNGNTYKYFNYGADVKDLNQNLIFNNAGNGSQLGDFNFTFTRDLFLTVTDSGVTEN